MRRNDLDGRGTIREAALADFAIFILKACIDQVRFMEGLAEPNRLRIRILRWAEVEVRLGQLPAQSGAVLEVLLYRGELPRGEVETMLNSSARRVTSAWLERGVLTSVSSRAPLRLVFPACLGIVLDARIVPRGPLDMRFMAAFIYGPEVDGRLSALSRA